MGCLARVGCLILLVLLACAAWITRGVWLPDRFRSESATTSVRWEPVTNAGATRAQTALSRLGQPSGPVFETMSAADFVAYVKHEVAERVGTKADSVAARVEGDRLAVRARIDFSQLRGKLGTAAAVLADRETIVLKGGFHVLEPGRAEFEVTDASVGRVSLPRAMISRLIREIDRGARPKDVRATALPLPIPTYVGDIRVANGKVTVYKNVK